MNPTNSTHLADFQAGQIQVEGDTTTHKILMDMPGNKQAAVTLRIGNEGAAEREKQREEFYLTVYPPSLTEGLEKDIKRLDAQYNDLTGYDKEGKPLMRFTGRDREMLEMKLANRRNALAIAQRNRAFAERAQAHAKAERAATSQRIAAAAAIKAQQMIEDAEIDRRASQIAARAGVRSK